MLKLAGAILLIAAGAFAGSMESHRLTVRVRKLEAFLRFLSSAKTEIRYSAMPVAGIVEKHGGELSFLSACAERCADGEDWPAAWSAAVNEKAGIEGFFSKDLELLRGFGADFGASDTEGQLSHCSLYADLTAAALEGAKEDRNRKSKLYQMLGIFAGMAAALLLC